MSALQTLRNKAGLLVSIVIGFALVAFILGDFLSSNNSASPNDRVVAEINGEKISVDAYFALITKLEEDYKSRSGGVVNENTRNYLLRQAWDQLVRESMMNEQYGILGLGVEVAEHGILGITPEELKDIVVGNNVDAQIQQIFANPETGVYDRNIAINFLKNMDSDPQRKSIWLGIEKSLMQNQLGTKYNALINKGLYVTAKEAELNSSEKNQKVAFNYAGFKFNSVLDSTVNVSDDEIKAYYNTHKDLYKTEAYRDIDYVVFDVKASQDDYNTTEKWCFSMKSDFISSEDDALFVKTNSDIPYQENLYTEGGLPAELDSSFYYEPVGTVVGPYFYQGHFKLAKMTDKVSLPDSVNARHILVKSGDAQKIVDSLKGLLNSGSDFAELAKEFSEDPGSGSKGGDLGWFTYGAMVKSFNDTCFYGEVGQIYTAYSRHGIHIIEILNKGAKTEKALVSILAAQVKPSTTTINKVYGEAGRFAGENLTAESLIASAKEKGLLYRRANKVKINDRNLSGQENSRQIVKWSFTAEVNNVSEVFEVDGKFIIAGLVGESEKGINPISAVTDQISSELRNDKKAEVLIAKIKSTGLNTVSEIANTLNTPLNATAEVSFADNSINGLGSEPALVGTVAGLNKGILSDAVKGNSGVYIAEVTNINEVPMSNSITEKQSMEKSLNSSFGRSVQEVLTDLSDIIDNRYKFE